MAEGLLGGLAGSGSLPLNGLLGGLNGAAAPSPAGLSQAGGAPTLQLPGCLNSLTEQQRHLLQQQEQQLQQLQQLLASPQLTPVSAPSLLSLLPKLPTSKNEGPQGGVLAGGIEPVGGPSGI